MYRYKQFGTYKSVPYHNYVYTPYPVDETSGSKHVEDIKSKD